MHGIKDTTGNPKYDDTGHIEIKYHAQDGNQNPIVAVSNEVYSLTGQRSILFVKGVRYTHTGARPLHHEQIYTKAGVPLPAN